MKKVSVIGLFCTGQDVADGQSVKTRIVTQELEKALGADQVRRIDTYGWKKNPMKLFLNCVMAVLKSENVMFMTDEGGIRVFPWLLYLANIRKKCKLHYYVVGGWLGTYLDRSASAAKILKKLDAVYVELSGMELDLHARGFKNVVLVNKFRRMTPVSLEELDLIPQPPYKLCYFSRVMKEKGVEECIEAVKLANHQAGFEKYTLDIFGSVNPGYQARFEELTEAFPSFIRYGGVVDFQSSSSVLKDYFAMLFPTYYASEGYPNTVVDAFAAGLPIIATRWNYNTEVIHDHTDGILVDVKDVRQIVDAMEYISSDSEWYASMRVNCLARCQEYLPEIAVSKVIEQLR